MLRAYDLEAPDAELTEISEAFGGHALALTLLATYLRDVCDGDVRRWREVPILDEDAEQGGHAFRVMQSYEEWLGQGADVAVLYLLGLFDRPAGKVEIGTLLEEPAIPGLTDKLVQAGQAGWKRAVARLRKARLLSDRGGPGELGGLDAHPLVRTYFGERLKELDQDAYRVGHQRLYEYLKQAAPHQPATLEEMQPLYHAIHHGCLAGKVQEAYREVYRNRTHRGEAYFSLTKLYAFGSDLAAQSGFFERLWDRPFEEFGHPDQGDLLGVAGYALRAQGRLLEAMVPLQRAVEVTVLLEDWGSASLHAANRAELLLILGRVEEAVVGARESVELSKRSDDAFRKAVNLSILGDALHQAAQLEEAQELFGKAEEMESDRDPDYPLLYSLRGYRYCDLLLATSLAKEGLKQIRHRAQQTLYWMENKLKNTGPLDVSLGNLTLGQIYLALARSAGGSSPNSTQLARATDHLNRAVDGLRQAGHQWLQPLGFLARATLYRLVADSETATQDLDEVFEIAERGGMRLHLTDAHLERARLRVSQGQTDEAREDLEAARTLVAETGYHRRDPEVAALEVELGR